MSNYPEKCHVNGCPCGYFSSKSPSEASTTGKGDAGFLVLDGKNVSQGISGPVTATCRDCQGSGAGDGLAGVCPYCHGSGQVETYESRRQRLAVTVPDFPSEWNSAPRWTTRYTEQQVAEYWFIRGQHAKEVELVTLLNLDLAEIVRVARERVGR